MTCTTHHHARDCREQKTAVLIKAALDARSMLFFLSSAADGFTNPEEKARVLSIRERIAVACEDLQAEPSKRRARMEPEEDMQPGKSYQKPGVTVHRIGK